MENKAVVRKMAPEWSAMAYQKGFKKVNLSDYKG